jgi:hypothetical protein
MVALMIWPAVGGPVTEDRRTGPSVSKRGGVGQLTQPRLLAATATTGATARACEAQQPSCVRGAFSSSASSSAIRAGFHHTPFASARAHWAPIRKRGAACSRVTAPSDVRRLNGLDSFRHSRQTTLLGRRPRRGVQLGTISQSYGGFRRPLGSRIVGLRRPRWTRGDAGGVARSSPAEVFVRNPARTGRTPRPTQRISSRRSLSGPNVGHSASPRTRGDVAAASRPPTPSCRRAASRGPTAPTPRRPGRIRTGDAQRYFAGSPLGANDDVGGRFAFGDKRQAPAGWAAHHRSSGARQEGLHRGRNRVAQTGPEFLLEGGGGAGVQTVY